MSVIYRCDIKQHGRFETPECPVCKKKAQLCNHRSLLKLWLNPILRCFGIEIASVFNDDKFSHYIIRRYRK